jgi:hypothetical protein
MGKSQGSKRPRTDGLEYAAQSPRRWQSASESSFEGIVNREAIMDTHVFRLIVTDRIDEEGANRLFDAGINDGFPESGPEGHSIGFDREAPSLEHALLSAIEEVESSGFEVLRVEPDEFVSAADIADRTGRSRQSISLLINGARGPGDWPRPVAGNVRSPLWRWNDIAGWFQRFDGSQQVDQKAADFIAAVNEVLVARRALKPMDQSTRKLLIRQLAS